MAELPRYRPLGVALAPAPRIDYAGAGAVEARGWQNMSQALDRMSAYVFEKAGEQAKISGAERGAKEAPQVLRELMGRDRADFTIYEQAAYETAVKTFSVDVEAQARRTMGEIILRSNEEGVAPEVLDARLTDAIDGFSDSINMLSPDEANSLKGRLSSVRDAQYLKASERQIELRNEQKRSDALLVVDDIGRAIEDLGSAGVPPERLERELNDLRATMAVSGFSSSEIARTEISLRERFHVARLTGEFDKLQTPEQRVAFVNELQKQKVTGGPLVEGLDDRIVKPLVTSFINAVKADQAAVKSEVSDLRVKVRESVTAIVDKGFSPEAGVTISLRRQAAALAARGGDVSDITEALDNAQQDAAYYRSLNPMNLGELTQEQRELERAVRDGATPQEARRLQIVKSRVSGLRETLNRDPLSWAKSTGQMPDENIVARLSSSPPDQWQAILDRRVKQAVSFRGSQNLKGDLLIFDLEESIALARFLEEAPLDNQIRLIAGLNDGMGIYSYSAFKQISDSAPVVAHAAGLLNAGSSPRVVADLLRGNALLKEKAALKMSTDRADKVTAAIALLGGNLVRTPKLQASILAGADALYAATGLTEYDASEYQKALQLSAGGRYSADGDLYGGIAKYRQSAIIIPNNIKNDDLENLLDKMTQEEFLQVSNNNGMMPVAQDGSAVGWERLKDNLSLVSVEDGVVAVKMRLGDQTFDPLTLDGSEFQIDLRSLADLIASRPVVIEEPVVKIGLPEDRQGEVVGGPQSMELPQAAAEAARGPLQDFSKTMTDIAKSLRGQ